MRNNYKFLSIFVMLAFFIANISAQTLVPVQNAGFEENTAFWGPNAASPGAATFTIDSLGIAQEGTKCLKAVVTALGTNHWDVQMSNTTWAVEVGKSYRYSQWIQNANPSTDDTILYNMTVGYVITVDGSTSYPEVGHLYDQPILGGGVWTQLVYGFVASVGSSNGDDTIISQADHYRSVGTYYVDNLEIYQTDYQNTTLYNGTDSLKVYFTPQLGDATGMATTEFTVTVNDVDNPVTAIIQPDLDNYLQLKLTTAYNATDAVEVTYTPGTLLNNNDEPIEAFTWLVQAGSGASNVNDNISDANFKVFPNPATDVVYFENNYKINSVQFIDITGKAVKTVEGSNITNVNISDLNKGLYLMRINSENGKNHTGRLIVE